MIAYYCQPYGQMPSGWCPMFDKVQFNDLVQDCSISSALAMEILQSCTDPLNQSYDTNRSTILHIL